MSHLAWAKGGEATLVELDGVRARLKSTTPAAPGTPLEGKLDDGAMVLLKVVRCKREGETFTIEGRLIGATRELLTRLSSLAAP